jgi:hypothetical protein
MSDNRDAVIFRTHFWDGFAQRQFDRLLARAQGCDVFVLVDETQRKVDVPHDRVVRVTESDVLDMGFVRAGEGSLLWFNGDYPLYHFLKLHPGYTHVLQLEYDAVLNVDIGGLMRRMRADNIDFIGLTKGEPAEEWFWRTSCAPLYDAATLRHQLICVSAFSARALQLLWQRRLEHARLWRGGLLKVWPMCEAFIATELAEAGLNVAELSSFGDTGAYDHWPPYLEADLPTLASHVFIHPVLDQNRYISSMLKYKVGLSGYLHLDSLFHRKLRRLPAGVYLRALVTTFAGKAARVTGENLRRWLPGQAAPQPSLGGRQP